VGVSQPLKNGPTYYKNDANSQRNTCKFSCTDSIAFERNINAYAPAMPNKTGLELPLTLP
jgi:hypothetical protein